jgi:hypothetical protein
MKQVKLRSRRLHATLPKCSRHASVRRTGPPAISAMLRLTGRFMSDRGRGVSIVGTKRFGARRQGVRGETLTSVRP